MPEVDCALPRCSVVLVANRTTCGCSIARPRLDRCSRRGDAAATVAARRYEVDDDDTVLTDWGGVALPMEMAYRERWKAEIAAMRRVLAGCAMTEERKWG